MNLDLTSLFILPTTSLSLVSSRLQTMASESYTILWCFFFLGKQSKSVHILPSLMSYCEELQDSPEGESIQRYYWSSTKDNHVT